MTKPFCGGLRTNFVDTRDVVRAVADEGEIIDHLLGPDVELRFHAGTIVDATAHGVDQRDLRPDELAHIFVAGRDHHGAAGVGGALGERTDDIVRLDTADAQ